MGLNLRISDEKQSCYTRAISNYSNWQISTEKSALKLKTVRYAYRNSQKSMGQK